DNSSCVESSELRHQFIDKHHRPPPSTSNANGIAKHPSCSPAPSSPSSCSSSESSVAGTAVQQPTVAIIGDDLFDGQNRRHQLEETEFTVATTRSDNGVHRF